MKVLCICIHQGYWPVNLCVCVVFLSGFGIGKAGLIRLVWKFSHLFNLFFFSSLTAQSYLQLAESSLSHAGSLVAAYGLLVGDVESSFLTRDQTWAPCVGNTES